jgi:dTDP-4-dehydrorhamnose reductase
MKIAVTGHRGRLGSELVRRGCIPIKANITDERILAAEIKSIDPDVVINCAAYTDVSDCETHDGYIKALDVNYYGVKNIRRSFPKLLVHISTDYIFDGKKGPYSENSKPTTAVNAYGLTKQGAEVYLQSMPFPFSIVRTTCLYDNYVREDFVSSALKQLEIGWDYKATTKLSGNPTYVPHLSEGIMKLIELPKIPEIIHIAGAESMTRYEFALMIAGVFGYNKEQIIPTNKLFGAGNRPAKGGLKTRLAEKLGLPIYSALEGLKNYKEALDAQV